MKITFLFHEYITGKILKYYYVVIFCIYEWNMKNLWAFHRIFSERIKWEKKKKSCNELLCGYLLNIWMPYEKSFEHFIIFFRKESTVQEKIKINKKYACNVTSHPLFKQCHKTYSKHLKYNPTLNHTVLISHKKKREKKKRCTSTWLYKIIVEQTIFKDQWRLSHN